MLDDIKNLLESIIDESLEEIRDKYYKDIPEDVFTRLVALDPTFHEKKDKMGNYGKWILNLYKKDLLKEEDEYKVTEYLEEFEQVKNHLEDKDIGKYKTLQELSKALNTVDVELSPRQKLRARKKEMKDLKARLEDEAELVHDGEKWEVWIPDTENASCILGSGTHWCTASVEGRYNAFDSYHKSGNLFININKEDRDEKYQFHFQESQFMDSEDDPVSLYNFLKDNEELRDFYVSYAQEHREIIKNAPQLLIFMDKIDSYDANEFLEGLSDHSFKYSISSDNVVECTCDLDDFLESVTTEGNRGEGLSSKFMSELLTTGEGFESSDYSFNSRDAKLEIEIPEIESVMSQIDENLKPQTFEDAWDGDGEALEYLDNLGIDEDTLQEMKWAYTDAWSSGSMQEAEKDILSEIKSNFFDFEIYDFNKALVKLGDIKTVLDSYRNIVDSETGGGDNLEYNLDDYNFIACWVAEHNSDELIKIYEPHYGWSGFDKELFQSEVLRTLNFILKNRDRLAHQNIDNANGQQHLQLSPESLVKKMRDMRGDL